jgi:hypothetical protein
LSNAYVRYASSSSDKSKPTTYSGLIVAPPQSRSSART